LKDNKLQFVEIFSKLKFAVQIRNHRLTHNSRVLTVVSGSNGFGKRVTLSNPNIADGSAFWAVAAAYAHPATPAVRLPGSRLRNPIRELPF
jgi:hypothetical protein